MGFADRLIHSLVVVRKVVTTDINGDPVLDENGQPTTTEQRISVAGLVQPKSAREVALISQAGAAISDHTIYVLPTTVSTQDSIEFVPDDGRHYNVLGVRDAAGIGHHLEIDARLVA